MRNSPRLPSVCLLVAIPLGIHLGATSGANDGPLNELELGEAALALTLLIFGIQGLISVIVEGQELQPGRVPERLTDTLSISIAIFSVALFVIAIFLAYGISDSWSVRTIGILAGAGSIILSLLLVFYKEAFVGDETNFDQRQDGVPW